MCLTHLGCCADVNPALCRYLLAVRSTCQAPSSPACSVIHGVPGVKMCATLTPGQRLFPRIITVKVIPVVVDCLLASRSYVAPGRDDEGGRALESWNVKCSELGDDKEGESCPGVW